MSTSCIIASRLPNQRYQVIHCQSDGYDQGTGVGPTLRRFFNTAEAAD